MDQIFTLRRLFERCREFQQPLAVLFIDFTAAFDSVHRDSLWNLLLADGFPAKIVNILKNLYKGCASTVRVYGQFTDSFPVESGVRQGCVLSPSLFNVVVDSIMRRTLADINFELVSVGAEVHLSDVAYAMTLPSLQKV